MPGPQAGDVSRLRQASATIAVRQMRVTLRGRGSPSRFPPPVAPQQARGVGP